MQIKSELPIVACILEVFTPRPRKFTLPLLKTDEKSQFSKCATDPTAARGIRNPETPHAIAHPARVNVAAKGAPAQ